MAQPPSRREDLLSTITSDKWSGLPPHPSQRPPRDPLSILQENGITVPANLPPRVVGDLVRIVSLMWVNGNIIPREEFHIDPADEGLLFGRGVWESTRTFDHVPWLWPLHLERLLRTANLLDIDIDPSRLPTSDQVREFSKALAGCDVVIRLNVTAGWPAVKRPGLVWMTAMVLPAPMASARLLSCRTPSSKDEPYRVWKTFQYGGRMQAAQQATTLGYDSALLLDAEGNLLEMAQANIFVRLPDGWVTPPANGDLLPGTVRQHLLANSPITIREQTIPSSVLGSVSEVFVTNSKVGIVPIVQIDNHNYPIGNETQELIRWLNPDPAKA
ncbi:MAG: aminotransferase class IV [Planctomycetes bacterium]|nr:aminotransferase class IV [Planctomycetota bacterium]